MLFASKTYAFLFGTDRLCFFLKLLVNIFIHSLTRLSLLLLQNKRDNLIFALFRKNVNIQSVFPWKNVKIGLFLYGKM